MSRAKKIKSLERLPRKDEKGTEFLICYAGPDIVMDVALWFGNHFEIYDSEMCDWSAIDSVTHWMPLPPSPKGETAI